MRRHEFHISRLARDTFQFDDSFFSIRGDIVLTSARSAQRLAEAINEKRRALNVPVEDLVRPAELFGIGLLHEILHFIVQRYKEEREREILGKCHRWLCVDLGTLQVEKFLATFADLFPPLSVYRGEMSPAEYVAGSTGGTPNRIALIEEAILVYLQNRNPALASLTDLFDDDRLRIRTAYPKIVDGARRFMESQPGFGPDNEPLLDMLLAPVLASPGSVMCQLEFIRTRWEKLLSGTPLMRQLLLAIDFIKEEGKYFLMLAQAQMERSRVPHVVQWKLFGAADGESPPVPQFKGADYESEPERFSKDLNWMPRLVLIAKSTFVWLEQLSREHERWIRYLSDIPDEELDLLARNGFTGLWLIGVWQRSRASERIKHFNGSADAMASAYSLDDYVISPELGGDEAYGNLRERAASRGIRLASDMVPNHMGIDSRWVINQPDWFIQSHESPYWNYSFNGPDLCDDERVGVFLEDGYWQKADAAVVFKRLDRWTGDVRYIYHGNDGTHMPWNDTAQLDFLNPEVREAVIQSIVHVAHLFPIIRFDAAMVLAKKHFQRLWFPQPGTGGAIPSRASFAMTKEEFDDAMPQEFWREVVDRIHREAPETLLLAEAFWLMEGYFVRTLGMHRVYNSAFMNMLKREENANYRSVIKNVLEYNPQILKRFVNFMNNPDEETAIAQFGKDDKYFGVCILMSTMPGVPMFGHGQVEGFTEKYGMEYRHPRRDEQPDAALVARHEREVFPLLRKRYLFSDVDNFLMYDCFTESGEVNEDVFAYSNRSGGERALVIYNNRFAHAKGWLRTSLGFLGDGGRIVQRTLGDGLALSTEPGVYVILRDQTGGLEYIRPNERLRREGFLVDLGAFKYHVFLDFREVRTSAETPYDRLCNELQGRGVNSVDEELKRLILRPIHEAVAAALRAERVETLVMGYHRGERDLVLSILKENAEAVAASAGEAVDSKTRAGLDAAVGRDCQALLFLGGLGVHERGDAGPEVPEDVDGFLSRLLPERWFGGGWRVLLSHLLLKELKPLVRISSGELMSRWSMDVCLEEVARSLGADGLESRHEVELLRVLQLIGFQAGEGLVPQLKGLLDEEEVQSFVGVNRFEDVLWFRKESLEELAEWLLVLTLLERAALHAGDASGLRKEAVALFATMKSIESMAASSEYQYERFLQALSSAAATFQGKL